MKLRVGTLFSGIGAPEFALKRMGVDHEVLYACDFDSKAKANYLANHCPSIFYDNIFDIDPNTVPKVDLLIAGFPCQPYSIGGKGLGSEDERSKPLTPMLNIIEATLPKTLVLENVAPFLRRPEYESIRKFLFEKLENFGYFVTFQVVNSKHFGVPQNRARSYIVASLDGEPPSIPVSNGDPMKTLQDIVCSEFVHGSPKVLPKDHSFYDFSKVFAHRPNYDQYLTKNGNPAASRRVYRVDGMGPCLTTVGAQAIKIGDEIREFGTDELLKMQGFEPSEFRNVVKGKVPIRQQIGNSMTIPVLEAIFRNLGF